MFGRLLLLLFFVFFLFIFLSLQKVMYRICKLLFFFYSDKE